MQNIILIYKTLHTLITNVLMMTISLKIALTIFISHTAKL